MTISGRVSWLQRRITAVKLIALTLMPVNEKDSAYQDTDKVVVGAGTRFTLPVNPRLSGTLLCRAGKFEVRAGNHYPSLSSGGTV